MQQKMKLSHHLFQKSVIGNPAKKIYSYEEIIEENKQRYPDKMW